MKYLLIFFVAALTKLYFTPTTYYITPSGSGSGTGLDSGNSMSYAALFSKTLASGDTVKFKAGNIYSGQHYAKDGAIYTRYSAGSNPLITGFTTLTTWTLSSGHIYYTTISNSALRGVSLDGVIQRLGRYPNSGYLTYTSHTGNSSITGTSVGTLPSSFVGGEVVIRKFRYILDRHIITGRSGNTLSYSSTDFYGNSSQYTPTDPEQPGYGGNGYFVQNHLTSLDQEGEWCYDAAAQRLYMHFGAGTPTGRVVKAATVDELIPLNSTVGAKFFNIDVEGANSGFVNNGTNNIEIKNCNVSQCGVGVYAVNSNNLKVAYSNISDCWSNGILAEANDHNTIIDNVTTKNTAVIPGLGQSGDGRYNAIAVNGVKTTITNSIIKNTGFNGISFGGDSVLVEHNLIDTFCTVKDDGAGVYTFAGDGVINSNRIVRNNIILDAIGSSAGAQANGDPTGEAAAIYLDGNTNHAEISNNSGAHGPWAGIIINGNPDNQILNNTMFNFHQQMLVGVNTAGSVRNLTITGNKFIARDTTQKCLWVSFNNGVAENPVVLGSWNNNYYARPVDDSLTITLFRPNSGFIQHMSLATWKSTYSQDANSNKSAVTTNDVNNLVFKYNFSASSASVSLPGVYKDILSTSFPGLVSVPSYSSTLLIYNSLLPTGSILMRVGPFKVVKQ